MLRHDRDSRLFGAGYKCGPQACYVAGGVVIAVLLCSTLLADKLLACSLSAFTADMAGLRSVGRINQNYWNTFAFGLVFQEQSKLIERPRVMQSSLSLSQLLVCSFPDVCQVFKGNGRILSHSLIDDLTGYPVVDCSGIPCLASFESCRESAATAPRGSRPTACFRLNRPSNLRPAQSVGRHCSTREFCSIGKNGEINNAHVHTEDTGGSRVDRIGFFNNDVDKVVFALFAKRGTFWSLALQCFPLIVADVQSKSVSPVQECETYKPVSFFERENTKIVVNTCRPENAVARFLLRQPGRDAGNGTNSEIGGQAEVLSNVSVTEAVQFKLPLDLVLAAIVGNIVAGIGEGFHSCLDGICGGEHQLALNGSYAHREHSLTDWESSQQERKEGRDSSAAVETARFPRA